MIGPLSDSGTRTTRTEGACTLRVNRADVLIGHFTGVNEDEREEETRFARQVKTMVDCPFRSLGASDTATEHVR